MPITRRLLLTTTTLAALATARPAQAQTKWDLPAAYPAANFHSVNLQQFADDRGLLVNFFEHEVWEATFLGDFQRPIVLLFLAHDARSAVHVVELDARGR